MGADGGLLIFMRCVLGLDFVGWVLPFWVVAVVFLGLGGFPVGLLVLVGLVWVIVCLCMVVLSGVVCDCS